MSTPENKSESDEGKTAGDILTEALENKEISPADAWAAFEKALEATQES